MQGICRTETGFVVFVPSAVPGEKLTARIKKVKSGKLCKLMSYDNGKTDSGSMQSLTDE